MAIAFVNSVKVVGAGASGAVNMAACNGAGGLFVAIIGGLSTVSAPSADTGSNSWTPATGRPGAASGELHLYYVLAPSASASHTFTNGVTSFGSMIVLGFSGVGAFDKESGSAAPGVSTVQPGSLTPATDGTSVFVTAAGGGNGLVHSVNAPFTFDKENDFSGGSNYDTASGYFIQGAAGAQNPTWSYTDDSAAAMLVFAPAAAGVTVAQQAGIFDQQLAGAIIGRLDAQQRRRVHGRVAQR